MRWTRKKRSKNLEDRRFQTGGRRVAKRAGLGLGGLVLIFLLSLLTGQGFFALLGGAGNMIQTQAPASDGRIDPAATTPEEEELVEFINSIAHRHSRHLDRGSSSGWHQIPGHSTGPLPPGHPVPVWVRPIGNGALLLSR